MSKLDIPAIRKRYEAVLNDVPLGARVLRWVFQPTQKGWGRVWSEIQVDEDGMVGTTGLPGSPRVPEHIGEFIAHARTDLPAVVEALEEAQGKLDAVEEQAQRLSEAKFTGSEYIMGLASVGRAILRVLKREAR